MRLEAPRHPVVFVELVLEGLTVQDGAEKRLELLGRRVLQHLDGTSLAVGPVRDDVDAQLVLDRGVSLDLQCQPGVVRGMGMGGGFIIIHKRDD